MSMYCRHPSAAPLLGQHHRMLTTRTFDLPPPHALHTRLPVCGGLRFMLSAIKERTAHEEASDPVTDVAARFESRQLKAVRKILRRHDESPARIALLKILFLGPGRRRAGRDALRCGRVQHRQPYSLPRERRGVPPGQQQLERAKRVKGLVYKYAAGGAAVSHRMTQQRRSEPNSPPFNFCYRYSLMNDLAFSRLPLSHLVSAFTSATPSSCPCLHNIVPPPPLSHALA